MSTRVLRSNTSTVPSSNPSTDIVSQLKNSKKRRTLQSTDEDSAMTDSRAGYSDLPQPVTLDSTPQDRQSTPSRDAVVEPVDQRRATEASAEPTRQPELPVTSQTEKLAAAHRAEARLAAARIAKGRGTTGSDRLEASGQSDVRNTIGAVEAPEDGEPLRLLRRPNVNSSPAPSDAEEFFKAIARVGSSHVVYRIGKSTQCTYRVYHSKARSDLPDIQKQSDQWRRLLIKDEDGMYKYGNTSEIIAVGLLIFAPKKHCRESSTELPDSAKVKKLLTRKSKDRIRCYGRYFWPGPDQARGHFTWETRSDSKRIFKDDNDESLWLTLVAQELLYSTWYRQQPSGSRYPQPILTPGDVGQKDYNLARTLVQESGPTTESQEDLLPPWSEADTNQRVSDDDDDGFEVLSVDDESEAPPSVGARRNHRRSRR